MTLAIWIISDMKFHVSGFTLSGSCETPRKRTQKRSKMLDFTPAAGVPRCTGSTDGCRRWCEVPEAVAVAVAAVEFLVVVIVTRRRRCLQLLSQPRTPRAYPPLIVPRHQPLFMSRQFFLGCTRYEAVASSRKIFFISYVHYNENIVSNISDQSFIHELIILFINEVTSI